MERERQARAVCGKLEAHYLGRGRQSGSVDTSPRPAAAAVQTAEAGVQTDGAAAHNLASTVGTQEVGWVMTEVADCGETGRAESKVGP